ncbi:MAG: T9SS type A sorting domain-containing protein [Bacteroidia bacterium]|nr:T9SS type A sorting domain-containing protein [Bacteroidia bacterium]MCC6769428.1 T9SS type A sorting domain-containing protein [Bacteroidia bacterium]
MKQIRLLFLCLISIQAYAQTPEKTINGPITKDYTFYNDTIYVLDGFVYVKNNSTLTIEPGTLIKGIKATRSTLVITMGSKIYANGTASQPIVFTSSFNQGNRAPGDWGGIVILGRGLVNRTADCNTCPGAAVAANLPGVQVAIEGDLDNASGDGLYGGNDNTDSSGVLRFVRVEFAGTLITSGNEINSITFGGVGSKTVVEYIQVSHANDDAFEWFGGAVNAKYLIAQGSVDDDFDTDFGYSGKVQFAISQRDSFLFDTGSGPTTNGFESDNDSGPTFGGPRTAGVFSNVSMVGPCANGPLDDFGSFQNGARLRRNTQLSIFNSVFIGQRTGILLDGSGVVQAFLNDTLLLKNNLIAGSTLLNITTNQAAQTQAVVAKFMAGANDTAASSDGLLKNPFDYLQPDFQPVNGSGLLEGASFSGAKINDPFFTPVSFRGAVGDVDWTAGWTEFNALEADYSQPVYPDSANAIFAHKTESVNLIKISPNPAKDQACVEIDLIEKGRLDIAVYDLHGKLIKHIFSGKLEPGNQRFYVETTDMPAGVYLVKMQEGPYHTVSRMVISK